MRTIRHFKTLFHCDGPQVFEACDEIDGRYIGVMIEPDEVEDRFLLKQISTDSLRRFRVGSLDLRSLLLERTFSEWLLATASAGFQFPLTIGTRPTLADVAGFLPEPGFFLREQTVDSTPSRDAAAEKTVAGNPSGSSRTFH